MLTATAQAAAPGAPVAPLVDIGVPGVAPVFCRMDHADLTALVELADADKLPVRIGATYPLARTAEAQRALAAGETPGKIVIEIGRRASPDVP
ncbi:hypothetical protein SVIO_101890 [Streptomyces violaceusniger]|uniref:Alcohol dehydrogenase-like C-terminal domain-containing protein n=1 Tax=Streptomyces violaceusniger TaxID=68280 RepID=A0A4D4LJV0_STRVO|nr:hypothetical protein SVIO_101890 [Streptomyces violaceusniger]